jgi:predicted ABC-type ATPase
MQNNGQRKKLILVRGVSGAGKSSFCSFLLQTFDEWFTFTHHEADDYFVNPITGGYNFDASQLPNAHKTCQVLTMGDMMDRVDIILVSNTFTTEKELQPYLDMAEDQGYDVVSLVVENRHGNSSVHNVPEETLNKQRNRFSIKL